MRLDHLSWKTVRDSQFEIALLPWGATDRVVVLPPVPFGVNTGQLDIPLCLNLNPSSQAALLRDLAEGVGRTSVRKLVILNGHGGNDFRQMIRELQPATKLFLCTINWYACIDPAPFFAEPGDHAGELETSLMQHLAPTHVLPLGQAGDGAAREFMVQGLREGWAWAPRRWTAVTEDTGVGNPRAATPEKGARYFAAVTERIAGFLLELDRADPDARYATPP